MGRLIDLTGQKFGRWTVINRAPNNRANNTMWWCACECGTERAVTGDDLKSGKSFSCGCKRSETTAFRNRRHDGCGTRLYRIWTGMKERCYAKSQDGYKNYGLRGITVCDEWKDNFSAFRNWALSHGYQDQLTLERKDVNGNYCPDNCTWIPKTMQPRNTRASHVIEIDGKRQCLTAWVEEVGIGMSTFYYRVAHGMDEAEAILTPVRGKVSNAELSPSHVSKQPSND